MSYLVVTSSVADLRAKPKAHSGKYIKDLVQETQLLYGAVLEFLSQYNSWYRVYVPDQLIFKHEAWIPYPGWVHKKNVSIVNELLSPTHIVKTRWAILEQNEPQDYKPRYFSCGTELCVVDETKENFIIKLYSNDIGQISKNCLSPILKDKSDNPELRENLFLTACRFEGTPYLWGGRSGYLKEYLPSLTGVDCSALVNLCYKVNGVALPRNAQDQFLFSKKVEFKDLKQGDLIFLAHKEHPTRIYHVLIYLYGDVAIEATLDTGNVRFVTGEQKVGKVFNQIKSGEIVKDQLVYFGTILGK